MSWSSTSSAHLPPAKDRCARIGGHPCGRAVRARQRAASSARGRQRGRVSGGCVRVRALISEGTGARLGGRWGRRAAHS
eukprot:6066332-Prymnesium_polylepis.1